jgi:two-component system, OmpR family, sensor kinase
MSLRARLVGAVCVIALVALGSAGVATYALFSQSQLRQIDDSLRRTYEPLAALLTSERTSTVDDVGAEIVDGGTDDGGTDGEAGTIDADHDVDRLIEQLAPGQLVMVLDPNGTVEILVPAREPGHEPLKVDVADLTLPRGDATNPDDGPTHLTVPAADDSTEVRVRISRLPDGSALVIGLSIHEASESARRLVTIETIVTAISLILAAMLGWVLVRVGLRPLRDVEQTALAIASGGDLDREVPGGEHPTEVGRLAAALNTMLSRIRDAFSERDAKERALLESEARMRRFVADVSHELRTPLAAVAAYTELFERGARDRPEDLARAMRGIGVEADRMGELVEELLLLARLDEGRPLDRRRIDLVEVVIDAIAAARAVSSDWPIALEVTDVVVIDGDAGRLRQVLDNVLANVRTHTPPGTSISVEVGVQHDNAVMVIADDGPGMSAEQADRVFERFYRADPSRSRTSGGAGLGMAIVHALVTAHGGRITLDTAVGQGVRITVSLPLPTTSPFTTFPATASPSTTSPATTTRTTGSVGGAAHPGVSESEPLDHEVR